MYCSKCGNELKEDALFCNKCGSKIENKNKQTISEIKESKKEGTITLNEKVEQKKTVEEKFKILLKISIIALVCSIIIGNIFGLMDFDMGRYITMAILYASIGVGAISLIGYFVTKGKNNEKIPTWIIIIVGIIIALSVANGVSSIIEKNQKELVKYNINNAK